MLIRRNCVLFFVIGFLPLHDCYGDTFTVRQDDGSVVSVDARFAGEGQGLIALERKDGRLELVPVSQILNREPGPDPEPLSNAEVMDRLKDQFGAEKFRGYAEGSYVIGLVLSEPLPKAFENKATACLKRAANFLKTVEKIFLDFVNEFKLEVDKPRFPMVLLIFETDDDFVQFAAAETTGRGVSAGMILGYYSALSNQLAIRMSECHTFETPLHEAIHQQVFNRGLLQRFSPCPVWFSEGIATGFEGNGDKINGGPLRVSSRYAAHAARSKTVIWDDIVADDKAFRGDVLAGEAYSHAWSIHWFLLTRYRSQYVQYLKHLGQKRTLERDDASTRVKDFEEVFGKRVGTLQSEFPQALEQAARKQKISLDKGAPRSRGTIQSNLAEIEINPAGGESSEGQLIEGRMRNLSQIRPMSFYITVETENGHVAEWFLPGVPSQKIHPLEKTRATRRGKGFSGGEGTGVRVIVRTAVPESEQAKKWQRGDFSSPAPGTD